MEKPVSLNEESYYIEDLRDANDQFDRMTSMLRDGSKRSFNKDGSDQTNFRMHTIRHGDGKWTNMVLSQRSQLVGCDIPGALARIHYTNSIQVLGYDDKDVRQIAMPEMFVDHYSDGISSEPMPAEGLDAGNFVEDLEEFRFNLQILEANLLNSPKVNSAGN